jgi:hypothetical protein
MPPPYLTPFAWTDFLSILASIAAIIALPYAAYQIKQARITASASAAVTIFATISERIMGPEIGHNRQEWSNLLNDLELACALYFDNQFGGHTGKLAVVFIKDILAAIEMDQDRLEHASAAIHRTDTFECIQKFAAKYKKDWKALPA